MKKYSYLCFVLFLIFMNTKIAEAFSLNRQIDNEIGKLIITDKLVGKNDIVKLHFYTFTDLKQINLEIKDEGGNYHSKKKIIKVDNKKYIEINIELDRIKYTNKDFKISPYIKVKNKAISMVNILIEAKTVDNYYVSFNARIVCEEIENNKIKLWHLHQFFNDNGKNYGILNNYEGHSLTNNIGEKKNHRINDGDKHSFTIKRNNIDELSESVTPGASRNGTPITVTINGYIYYVDSNGNTKPLPYAEVAIWEEDASGAYSAFDWKELTSSTGYFSITVTQDDNDDDLELFLRVRSINTAISVELYQDFLPGFGLAVTGDAPFIWTGITQNNVTAGTTSMNFVIDDYKKGAAQIFDWLMTSTNFTRNAFDPGQVQAVWPGPGSNAYSDPSYNSNLVIGSLNDNANYPDVVFHEFGHTTMYRRNSYRAPNSGGAHSFQGLYSEGLAWSEGWATAYSQFILSDGRYDAYNFAPLRPHIENAKLGYGDGITYYPENTVDSHNEVWAAAALVDIYDYGEPDNGDDFADRIITFNEMISLIENNDINSVIDFYNLIITGNYLSDLEKNYASRVFIYNKFDVDLIDISPIISNLTQSPDPICQGSHGYVYCNLSQGSGNLSYTWNPIYLPSGAYITPLGSRCKVTYPNTAKSSDGSSDKIMAPIYEIECIVTNSAGSDTERLTLHFDTDCGSQCPTLAFEHNGKIVNDNPILTKSVSSKSDVTDSRVSRTIPRYQ